MELHMKNKTQLLCTFTNPTDLSKTINQIKKSYDVAFKSIHVLECIHDSTILCCTYNINTESPINEPIPDNTISVHRKKSTRTIYTINALNCLIEELNGSFDASFPIPWDELQNSILVTAYGHMKQIETKLREIIKLDD
jgi:hypothetical protein